MKAALERHFFLRNSAVPLGPKTSLSCSDEGWRKEGRCRGKELGFRAFCLRAGRCLLPARGGPTAGNLLSLSKYPPSPSSLHSLFSIPISEAPVHGEFELVRARLSWGWGWDKEFHIPLPSIVSPSNQHPCSGASVSECHFQPEGPARGQWEEEGLFFTSGLLLLSRCTREALSNHA